MAATLALLFAMSGGAIAATGGFTAASKPIRACAGSNGVLKLQTAKKCAKGQKAVTWSQTGPAGAKGAQGAAGPSGLAALDGAPVPSATTAQTAGNALALGGVPASDFTHSDCGSTTGQVKGFAIVPREPGHTFVPVSPSYNCSGESVEVMQPVIATAIYIVRFKGNPAEIAMTTTLNEQPWPTAATVKLKAPGEWEVQTTRQENAQTAIAENGFEMLVP